VCVFVINSVMLMKVKPDGPVYEVQFTSLLISTADNAKSVSTSPLSSQTSASDITSITSVCCYSRPVASNLPLVTGTHAQTAGTVASVTSHGSRVLKSDAIVSHPTQMYPSSDNSRQSASDSQLHCTAVTTGNKRYISGPVHTGTALTTSNTRYTSDSVHTGAKSLLDPVSTTRALHSDVAGYR